MAKIIYPPPLRQGDTIGITAPSAGIGPALEARYQFAVQTLREHGYKVREGHCLRNNLEAMTSAPAQERADELMAMLLDPDIAAVIPPWGGELLIDILPLLDFAALAAAQPKWILGYSDLSTLMLPFTLLTHIATAHGSNLLEVPNVTVKPLASWHDTLTLPAGGTLYQSPAARYEVDGFDWGVSPQITGFHCTEEVDWQCLGHEQETTFTVSVQGRLIGGCLDVISMLPGTPYGNVSQFAHEAAPEGLLVYLENVDGNSAQYCRMLHCMKLSGWFKHANAVLVGRSDGAELREFTNRDALVDALGDLRIPVIYDMDIGHQPPQMMLVNGALATLHYNGNQSVLQQTFS